MSGSGDISVIIATKNRAEQVVQVVRDIVKAEGSGVEVIVVDNGSTDGTLETLRCAFRGRPVLVLSQAEGGKSAALNSGMDCATGRLYVFTDDDVVVPAGWLDAYRRSAAKRPDAVVFCGPVDPVFETPREQWLRHSRFAAPTIALFRSDQEAGDLRSPKIPIGPNFAVRACLAADERFRPDLGPGTPAPMCEDTDFVVRMSRGGRVAYVPEAGLGHSIRAELSDVPRLIERAFDWGVSRVRMAGYWLGALHLTSRTAAEMVEPKVVEFDSMFAAATHLGECAELLRLGRHNEARRSGAAAWQVMSGTTWEGGSMRAKWLEVECGLRRSGRHLVVPQQP